MGLASCAGGTREEGAERSVHQLTCGRGSNRPNKRTSPRLTRRALPAPPARSPAILQGGPCPVPGDKPRRPPPRSLVGGPGWRGQAVQETRSYTESAGERGAAWLSFGSAIQLGRGGRGGRRCRYRIRAPPQRRGGVRLQRRRRREAARVAQEATGRAGRGTPHHPRDPAPRVRPTRRGPASDAARPPSSRPAGGARPPPAGPDAAPRERPSTGAAVPAAALRSRPVPSRPLAPAGLPGRAGRCSPRAPGEARAWQTPAGPRSPGPPRCAVRGRRERRGGGRGPGGRTGPGAATVLSARVRARPGGPARSTGGLGGTGAGRPEGRPVGVTAPSGGRQSPLFWGTIINKDGLARARSKRGLTCGAPAWGTQTPAGPGWAEVPGETPVPARRPSSSSSPPGSASQSEDLRRPVDAEATCALPLRSQPQTAVRAAGISPALSPPEPSVRPSGCSQG